MVKNVSMGSMDSISHFNLGGYFAGGVNRRNKAGNATEKCRKAEMNLRMPKFRMDSQSEFLL